MCAHADLSSPRGCEVRRGGDIGVLNVCSFVGVRRRMIRQQAIYPWFLLLLVDAYPMGVFFTRKSHHYCQATFIGVCRRTNASLDFTLPLF